MIQADPINYEYMRLQLPDGSGRLAIMNKHTHDVVSIPSGTKHPFPGGVPTERHNIYDGARWIGDNLQRNESPYRLIGDRALDTVGAKECANLFKRYTLGDYGKGEAGFAAYEVTDESGDPTQVWIIDDAVRSPEGEPPARDPQTSPGPQTMLLPEEY